jgi:sugar/nucleoside kinase (ribokinase family)
MKILVIGHLCRDVIHPKDEPETESPGGIYYAVVALASLLGRSDTVVPVFGVHRGEYNRCLEDLGKFPNIDPSGIFRMDEPTNAVHLYYGSERGDRREVSRDIAKPIPFEKIRRHLSADGILINLISGFDIELETLDQIRMAVRSDGTPIHLDMHSLSLGVGADNERFRRPVPEWRRWAFMVDTLQMNEEELAGMVAEPLSQQQIAGHLLTLGVKGVIVTKGADGAAVYYNEKKLIRKQDIPPAQTGGVRDTTGCGDVFGAAFLMQYVKSRDLLAAATVANNTAGSIVGRVGSRELREFLATSGA